MNWVIFGVLTGLILLNALGVGIYHYEWKHSLPYTDWRCKEFAEWTAMLVFFGTAYVVLRLILWIKSLFK